MKTKLTDIKINFISLVAKGANKRRVIFKNASEETPNNIDLDCPIIKYDDAKNMVYGIVYAPNDIDTDGQYTTEDEIEKTSQRFMRDLNQHNIDIGHDFNRAGAYVAENWMLRKIDGRDDPLFPNEIPGSWAVGIKLENPGLIEKAKSGALSALSMAGTANKHPTEKSRAKSIIKQIAKVFRKGDDMTKDDVLEIVHEEIAKQEKPLTKNEMATVFKSAFENATKSLSERIEKLETASPGSQQGDENVSKEADLEKLGTEIAKAVNVK